MEYKPKFKYLDKVVVTNSEAGFFDGQKGQVVDIDDSFYGAGHTHVFYYRVKLKKNIVQFTEEELEKISKGN